MQADPQIAYRFESFALPRWHESAALRELVVGFGRLLPLHKPSPFGDKAVIQKLMVHSGGLTGEITTLMTQAAELAVLRKTERINFAGPTMWTRSAGWRATSSAALPN